jgi:hypothetical protein
MVSGTTNVWEYTFQFMDCRDYGTTQIVKDLSHWTLFLQDETCVVDKTSSECQTFNKTDNVCSPVSANGPFDSNDGACSHTTSYYQGKEHVAKCDTSGDGDIYGYMKFRVSGVVQWNEVNNIVAISKYGSDQGTGGGGGGGGGGSKCKGDDCPPTASPTPAPTAASGCADTSSQVCHLIGPR